MSLGHLFWWAIATLGLGGALLAGAAIVLGWPVVLAFLNTKLGRIVAGIAIVLGAFVVVYGKGKSEGATAEKSKEDKTNADFAAKQAASDAAVAQLPESELDKLLHDSGEPKAGGAGR